MMPAAAERRRVRAHAVGMRARGVAAGALAARARGALAASRRLQPAPAEALRQPLRKVQRGLAADIVLEDRVQLRLGTGGAEQRRCHVSARAGGSRRRAAAEQRACPWQQPSNLPGLGLHKTHPYWQNRVPDLARGPASTGPGPARHTWNAGSARAAAYCCSSSASAGISVSGTYLPPNRPKRPSGVGLWYLVLLPSSVMGALAAARAFTARRGREKPERTADRVCGRTV